MMETQIFSPCKNIILMAVLGPKSVRFELRDPDSASRNEGKGIFILFRK
jgi:hypothetical protein